MCWIEVLTLFLAAGAALGIGDFYRVRKESDNPLNAVETALMLVAYFSILILVGTILFFSHEGK